MKKPKKPLTERFQQLAGIKPLYELEDASPGASGPGKKPQKDIERVMKLVGRVVNTRKEYEELMRAVAEFDVSGKESAIHKAFADYPAVKAALLSAKTLSDPEDNQQTYQFATDKEYTTTDSKGSGSNPYGEDEAIKYLSDNGTLHPSYISGKGVAMKEEDWAQFKGMYTINNDRLGYVKDDGSLHSAPMPEAVGEREALMDYIKNNFEETPGVPVVGSN